MYSDGELEGEIYHGEIRKRATDPIWSVNVHTVIKLNIKEGQPTLFYLNNVKRSFASKELQVVSHKSGIAMNQYTTYELKEFKKSLLIRKRNNKKIRAKR